MFRGFQARMRVPFALLVVLGGCARAPRVPPVPPPPAGYDRRVDDPVLSGGASLAGRRIVLDPGHGGFFRGALGVKGLTESEVNLGVALQLRDRLVAAGAEVLLTRASDRDFLSPADSALRTDLNARVALSEAFRPDAFVSIHHNADAGGRHDVNETITFYKLGDDGPSLELAQDVHRALVRHVGIQPQRVVPGNFAVLRGSTAPAILTETSYITYPPTETLLRLPEKQQIEAEALFVGLARYFARPVPVIDEFRAEGKGVWMVTGPHTMVETSDSPFRLVGRINGTFDDVRLTIDGREYPVTRQGGRFEWAPVSPPELGWHDAMVQASLAGQGSSRPSRLRFVVNTTGAITANTWRHTGMRTGQVLAMRLICRDEYGRLASPRDPDMPPDTAMRVRVLTRGVLTPSETTVTFRNSVGWLYPRLTTNAAIAKSPVRVRLELQYREGPGGVQTRDTVALTIAYDHEDRAWTGFAIQMPGGGRLVSVTPSIEPISPSAWINRDGFVALDLIPILPSAGRTPSDSIPVPPLDWTQASLPQLPGYRPWVSDEVLPPRYVAVMGGLLHGKRITVDPDGGGESSGGSGPGGTRGSHLNLAVARALRSMLEAAGADVLLTRDGDYAVSEVERVQKSETFRADRYVRIGHKAEAPRIGHYFSSAGGKKWAQRTGEILAALGLPAPPAAEDSQYPIQQTSCPALYAGFARVDREAEESRLLAPGTLRAEAYALLISIAREWNENPAWTLDSLAVRGAHGEPVDGAPVTLGGALVLETDPFGRSRFYRTETGPIEIAVDEPRVRARIVLIDSARAPTLTGPPGR